MLVPSTPEGAREFLVPSRKVPGSFYALPQSPQLFKQLLMVAGVDRYYQMARCLRDEDLRADRQYEFMQLDMEMSFVSQDDVLAAVSEAVLSAAEAATGERPPPIERITWRDAMDRFGVDKPDLRFGMELVELTDVFAATEFKAFAGAAAIKGIRVPGAADEYGRNQLDKLTDRAKSIGAKGLVWLKATADGFDSPVAKFLSDTEQAALRERLGVEPGDLVLIVADEWTTTCEVLGQLRNDLGRPPVHEGPYRYVWVVEFPLFIGDRRGDRSSRSPGTIRSACRTPTISTGSTPIRCRCGRSPTTSCSTGGSSAPARSGSTSPSSSAGCSPRSASTRRRRTASSGSSSTRSSTARRHTAGSPSASIVWWRSSPARRTSAR